MKKILGIIITCIAVVGQASAQDTDELFELSLEELMSIDITSVSKTAEKLQDVASSIYVVTQEDIERSGATRLQDVLNMVPGFYFAHTDYNDGYSGAREVSDGSQGSVLVLVDNVPLQSVYSSTFDYENYDIDLEEIDRIEVIKGPGGTIYGANAATGIINIFTKSAEDSQGFRATFNQGTNGFIAPSVRYGTKIDNTSLKFHAKGHFFDGYQALDQLNGDYVTVPKMVRDASGISTGMTNGDTTILNNLNDDVYLTKKFNVGFSAVSQVSDNTRISGHAYMIGHDYDTYLPEPTRVLPTPQGSFFLYEVNSRRYVTSARVDHNFSENHSIFAQISGNKEGSGDNDTYIGNLEIQDNLTVGKNNLSFGLNARVVDFSIGPFPEEYGLNFTDPNTSEHLWGVFAQDKINFSDKFNATLGIKAETWSLIDNTPELSPSLRLAFKPSENTTIWGAGSRSVTTPGFIQTNIVLSVVEEVDPIPGVLPDGLPPVIFTNSDDIDQTEYLTAELGFKGLFGNFSIDVSGFYAQATGIIGFDGSSTPLPSPLNPDETVVAILYKNAFDAENYGVETVLKYVPSEKARFELSHAWFKNDRTGRISSVTGERFTVPETDNPIMPEHLVRLRSYFTFNPDIELSFNGSYRTAIHSNTGFIYDQQSRPGGRQGAGFVIDEDTDRFRLDFKLAKKFNDGKASIFIWGTDIFNTGLVERYDFFQTGIPKQIHNLFGAGATISF
ncbi:hypothetical protein FNH22_03270 [Fulvivirga sp. M361]|uniref:TonB-dependent receptor plug domain-containing protein n=1 Tax=Fulvivirga sp. M361 TaxID=2594266 RepID=UPI00117ABA98|nr:TonB-dependent receptor [Fulvivirga sp. M361]TRX61813.1 hypothetical protein FNH22_03270 [Fulvivirga sp. M361]